MCSSDLFWGPSTVLRAFLAFMKSRGFGPFSQLYELLHTVLGYVGSFKGIFGSHENSWIWSFLAVLRAFLTVMNTRGFGPFSQFYELLHTVLGSLDSFEDISGIL